MYFLLAILNRINSQKLTIEESAHNLKLDIGGLFKMIQDLLLRLEKRYQFP